MSRNHRKGGSLASYFYEAAGGDGLGPLPGPAKTAKAFKSSILPDNASNLQGYFNGVWMGPGPEPKHHVQHRRRRSTSRPPKAHPPRAEGDQSSGKETKKKILAHMKNSLTIMREHFKETEKMYEAHSAWPLNPIYLKIQDCIEKCKQEIRDARTHTGPGRHKLNVEAVHAKRIDTSGWGFKAIHDAITGYMYQAKTNHLRLESPHHHKDGTHMYVNVVLAWLFAAKRQVMSNLAVYIEQAFNKTPAMLRFIEHEHKGREAFAAYHRYKKELPKRKHKSYHLEDQDLLTEQYVTLYG